MPTDLERERLELERERLQEETRLKEAGLELARRRLEASLPRTDRSWGAALRASLVATIPLAAALAAPTIGLIQFGLSQEQAAKAAANARIAESEARAETARLEARKAFNAKRLALYEKAIAVTGRLASDRMDSPGFEQARRDFERLYWAELPLVEDTEVRQAMVKLRPALYRPDAEEINQLIIDVAHAIRAELRDMYGRKS
jgi:hypothetical protein